jgi:hypothetical protein
VGDDNLFKGDRYKWSLTLTAVNVTNKLALYNFLSTFSGTHYVTPPSAQVWRAPPASASLNSDQLHTKMLDFTS